MRRGLGKAGLQCPAMPQYNHCSGDTGRWAGALGARRQARQACVGAGRGAQAGVRGRARGRAAAGRRRRRAAGRWASGARAAWAPGLAFGSALDPFSIRFDSFFFLSHQMNTVHCKINLFRKKNNIY